MRHLGSIGGFMALAGLISIVLYFLDYNLRILSWIDAWGTGAGWAIRIALVVVGGLLALVGMKGGGGDDDS